MNKTGMNPVTVHPARPDCSYSVTIGRVWTHKDPDRHWTKNLVFTIYNPNDIESSMRMTVLDEDFFIDALGYLFPNGELANCHEEVPE